MWIGLLTPGVHPGRPAASEGLATLFSWTRDARARIDGPMPGITAGMRMVRASTAADPACRPRCFTCRLTYLVPDPAAIRALSDDEVHELGAGEDEADPSDDDDDDEARITTPRRAVFGLVHVDDDAPAGDEGEVLFVVPGTRLVSLIPFDCVADFAMIAAEAYGELQPEACDGCGTVMPGGTFGQPGRAARRQAA